MGLSWEPEQTSVGVLSLDLCSIEPVLGFLKGAGRKQELNVFEFCTLCTKSLYLKE